MRKVLGVIVLLCVLYFVWSQFYRPSPHEPDPYAGLDGTPATSPYHAPKSLRYYEPGSGHHAGYEWADENSIADEDDCDTAGESHNSPSFAEGCKNFVNGEDEDNGVNEDDDRNDDDRDDD